MRIWALLAILLFASPAFAGVGAPSLTADSSNRLEVAAVPAANSFVNEDTATSQNLCSSSCIFLRHITGVADAGTTVEYYDEADATCDSGKIITIDTSAVASIAMGLTTINGLCMKTIGHDTGNITAVYK